MISRFGICSRIFKDPPLPDRTESELLNARGIFEVVTIIEKSRKKNDDEVSVYSEYVI